MLRHLSGSDFGKAVQAHQADKGARTLSTFDFFKQTVYGQLSGCFSAREIANSLSANGSKLYHAGLPRLKRSAFCDAMEKRDHRVFEDVFHAVADKAQMIAGKTRYDWDSYRKARRPVMIKPDSSEKKLKKCLTADEIRIVFSGNIQLYAGVWNGRYRVR